jgi:beta-glucosidase
MASLILLTSLIASSTALFPYQDASQPIQTRVNDLLSRMTLEEKIAQTAYQHWSGNVTQDCLSNPNGMGGTPVQGIAYTNALQGCMVNHTRLGIPVSFYGQLISLVALH